MKPRPSLLATILLALALLLSACSGPSLPTTGPGTVTDAGGPAAAPLPDQGGGEERPTDPENSRQVARTAYLRVEVEDPAAAAGRLRALATGLGGLVAAEHLVLDETDSGTASTVVVQVPAENLDRALEEFAAVGTVLSRSTSAEDVTDAVVDVDARVRTMRASIGRLEKLMERAGTLTEITALEGELTRRQADLEALVAQQKALRGRVAMATVTVTLLDPQDPTDAGGGGFLEGLASGWAALVATATFLLTALGAMLPFLAVVAAVGVPVLWWWRRHRRARGADSEA